MVNKVATSLSIAKIYCFHTNVCRGVLSSHYCRFIWITWRFKREADLTSSAYRLAGGIRYSFFNAGLRRSSIFKLCHCGIYCADNYNNILFLKQMLAVIVWYVHYNFNSKKQENQGCNLTIIGCIYTKPGYKTLNMIFQCIIVITFLHISIGCIQLVSKSRSQMWNCHTRYYVNHYTWILYLPISFAPCRKSFSYTTTSSSTCSNPFCLLISFWRGATAFWISNFK